MFLKEILRQISMHFAKAILFKYLIIFTRSAAARQDAVLLLTKINLS